MPASKRADQIQQMLISRLEKKIKSLEEKASQFDQEIESLKKEKESLRDSMRKMASESSAKIYLLEEARDDAMRRSRQLEEQLELERALVARDGEKRQARNRGNDDS